MEEYKGKNPLYLPQIGKKGFYLIKNISIKVQNFGKLLFTDESKFNIFGCNGCSKIWRKANEIMRLENLVPTINHGSGSVMVWGIMAGARLGKLVFTEGAMDKCIWTHVIIYQNRLKCYHLKTTGFHLYNRKPLEKQQDNDPKHIVRIVKEWLLYNVPSQVCFPTQSPDLNPIEHMWEKVGWHLRGIWYY